MSKYQTNNEYYPTDELTRTRNEVINHITTKPTKPRYTIKTIVAYSLAKLINSHNKLIECTGFQDVVHEQAKNNEWNKIGNVYVYSVYLDTRLDPHRYVRIISLIKGNCHLFDTHFFTQLPYLFSPMHNNGVFT